MNNSIPKMHCYWHCKIFNAGSLSIYHCVKGSRPALEEHVYGLRAKPLRPPEAVAPNRFGKTDRGYMILLQRISRLSLYLSAFLRARSCLIRLNLQSLRSLLLRHSVEAFRPANGLTLVGYLVLKGTILPPRGVLGPS